LRDIAIAELRRHIPLTDCVGHFVACSCGWKLFDATDDLWQSWIDHLPDRGPAPELRLTADDRKMLHAAHIKWDK